MSPAAAEIDHAIRDAFEGQYVRLGRLRPELRAQAQSAARRFAAEILARSEAQARAGDVLDEAGLERNIARHRKVIEGKLERILARLADVDREPAGVGA